MRAARAWRQPTHNSNPGLTTVRSVQLAPLQPHPSSAIQRQNPQIAEIHAGTRQAAVQVERATRLVVVVVVLAVARSRSLRVRSVHQRMSESWRRRGSIGGGENLRPQFGAEGEHEQVVAVQHLRLGLGLNLGFGSVATNTRSCSCRRLLASIGSQPVTHEPIGSGRLERCCGRVDVALDVRVPFVQCMLTPQEHERPSVLGSIELISRCSSRRMEGVRSVRVACCCCEGAGGHGGWHPDPRVEGVVVLRGGPQDQPPHVAVQCVPVGAESLRMASVVASMQEEVPGEEHGRGGVARQRAL